MTFWNCNFNKYESYFLILNFHVTTYKIDIFFFI